MYRMKTHRKLLDARLQNQKPRKTEIDFPFYQKKPIFQAWNMTEIIEKFGTK